MLARSRRLVVERVVAGEVLVRIHGRRIAVGNAHVLHQHGQGVVASRGRAVHRIVAGARRVERIRHVRSRRGESRVRGRRGLLRLSRRGTKGRGAGLQGRRDGRVVGSLAAVGRRGIRRQLAIVAAGHGASRDAANAGVVVVKVLLGVMVGVDTQTSVAVGLNSRHIVGRVRLVQLGRRSQVGGGR